MQQYFALQFRRICRHIRDAGLHPAVGLVLALALFLVGSQVLFQSVALAPYLYPLIALSLLNLPGTADRNDFLKSCFPPGAYLRIRLLENLLVVAPFMLFAAAYLAGWTVLALAGIAALSAFFHHGRSFSFVLPTPFSRRPFEFPIGFRTALLAFLLAYALAGIAIAVDNFNLGVAAVVLPFLICMGFYTQPEPKFYVWVFAGGASAFLHAKLRTALLFSASLSMPALLAMLVQYPGEAPLLFLFALDGLLLVALSLLGKYAFYPSDINLVQGMAMGACIVLPPALLLILPHFYSRARHTLSTTFAC